jgi:hypothetical protein
MNISHANHLDIIPNTNMKQSKRGRGRGSRGSYKSKTYRAKHFNNHTALRSYSLSGTQNNNLSSSYNSYGNVTQKVCINPEILKRLGYSKGKQ